MTLFTYSSEFLLVAMYMYIFASLFLSFVAITTVIFTDTCSVEDYELTLEKGMGTK